MENTPKVAENILHDIEWYCNNYFNPHNDPTDESRDYPPAFLELADHVQQYREQPFLFVGEDKQMTPWQVVFARELAIWKRARFLR